MIRPAAMPQALQQAPGVCHMHATSRAKRPRLMPSVRHQAPPPLRPARVTNEGKEMRVDLPGHPGLEDEEYMVIDPENTFWNRPELGALERHVSLGYEDGLFEGEVDPAAMEYWFTEPPGGWRTEPRRLRKVPTVPWQYESLAHPGDGRLALDDVGEGEVFQGLVTRIMLYHGAQVDIGAEFDGLIPICELDNWRPVEGEIDVGTALEVRVFRVRDPSLFRFPIQLLPTDPHLAAKLPPPGAHEAPMDLRDTKLSLAELAAISGRDWEPKKWVLETESDRLRKNFEPEDMPVWDQVSDRQLEALDRIAGALIEGMAER